LRKFFTILSIIFFAIHWVYGQDTQWKKKIIPSLSQSVYLDSSVIIPQSVLLQVNLKTIDTAQYQVNAVTGVIVIKDSLLIGASAMATYQIMPINLQKKYFNKDIRLILPDRSGMYNPFVFNGNEEKEKENFFNDGLSKNGSIARGVSFGNNQNVVLNSSLNLQLSGKLTEKVNVLAAVTDDNIPFQPQGNTQQLQEFDKVYIQVNDDRNKLIAGDFVLEKPNAYFMSYYKRAQGLNFSTGAVLSNKSKISTMVAAAVSKGKFSRNMIQGVEGNQGPYRLRGAENELFIIVLSGTERVFIDGQLLTRGQENDYVIDYNTSEITFTAKRFITKDRRIIVEFQYADKNYARSLMVNTTNYTSNKTNLTINYYNETDNKKRPLQQTLNDQRKQILAKAGDDVLSAIAPGIDSVGFRNDMVLYAKKDTSVNGAHYKGVYYFSINPDSAFYQLSFSTVGAHQGNYIQTASVANGRVFKWVAPVNGIKQGNYEPLVLLVSPKQKQMLDINLKQKIDSSFWIKTEIALSDYDKNTFSPRDDKDNQDMALKLNTEKQFKLSKKENSYALVTGILYEQLNKNFSAIERFRSVEFERDWNLLNHTQSANQYNGGFVLGIEKKQWGRIEWINQAFEEAGQIHGKQSRLNSVFSDKNWNVNHAASATINQNSISNDRFIRQHGVLSRRISPIRLSLKIDQEQNIKHDKIKADSLLNSSYQFSEWTTSISKADSGNSMYAANYSQRYDWLLKKNKLTRSAFAQSTGGSVELTGNKYFTLKNYTTYQQLKILDSMLTAQKPENNLLNRVEIGLRFFKSAIYTTTFYETNTGLELKKEYTFIQVAPGQGMYAWIDYNKNGIKELNEFELTPFPDQAQYIKVFTPTNNYIKVYGNQFNQAINITPASAINSKALWAKLINYWSNQFSYRIDRKTSSTEWQDQYNPFYRNVNDVFLQSINSSLRNTLFFNKTGYVFGADYTYQEVNGKMLLINGFELRNNVTHTLRARYNINRFFTFNTEANQGQKLNQSQLLSNRNFNLQISDIEPKLTYQIASDFRWSASYKYSIKQNILNADSTQGLQHKISSEIKYNKATKGSWTGRVSYYQINFRGLENSPVGYEILEGLRAGINYTWGIGYQQNLTNNLQITINYEGRKSGNLKTIHTGNITVRAIL